MTASLPTVAHDEPIMGDTLTIITLNHQWREWIAPLLFEELTRQLVSSDETEQAQLTQWISDLIDDLYDEIP